MPQLPGQDAPVLDQDGRFNPYWYRYLVRAAPTTDGGAHDILHGGGALGASSWGPVVLSSEVSSVLPVANGGTNLTAGVSGGILGFTGPATIAVSALLAASSIVLGGGPGALPSTPVGLGATTLVLHGNPAGPPTWGAVALASDVSGVLPVTNGGTGVTTSTGTGSNVLNTTPTLNSPTLNGPLCVGPTLLAPVIGGTLSWNGTTFTNPSIQAFDNVTASITGAVTTLVSGDFAMFVIVHDKTSGGMSAIFMDATGGVVMALAGIAGITFSRSAGVGLRAVVTAGANPRVLSAFAIAIGSA